MNQGNGNDNMYNTPRLNPRNNYRMNRQPTKLNNPIRCHTCNKIGLLARECRARPPANKRNNFNNFRRPLTQYNNLPPLSCTFCNKLRHSIQTC